PPFNGPTAQAILARHAVDPVAPIRTVRDTVSPGVERAVLKALAKVPADRHAGAAEFAQALAASSLEPKPAVRGARSRSVMVALAAGLPAVVALDRKSTRLNSSHQIISYAVFCLNNKHQQTVTL